MTTKKWIKGYTGIYSITPKGVITNEVTGKRLRPYCANKENPFLRVKLAKDGVYKNLYVHRLVAQTFLKKTGTKVAHLNSNIANNHVNNLAWY